MNSIDLSKLKDRILKEINCKHLYNPMWFIDLFNENIDISKIEFIQGPNEYVSREEVIDLVSKFLGEVSEDYQNEFYNYLINKKINFSARENCCSGNLYDNDFSVNMKERHDLSDVLVLTHEFFHALSNSNYKKRSYLTRAFYCELPSIMSELFMLDFLSNNGYNSEKYTEFRLIFFKNNVQFLSDFFKFYDLIINDKFDYLNIKNSFKGKDDKYLKSCINYISCGDYNIDECISHTYSLLLALKLKENNNSYDELISITDNLSKATVDEYNSLMGIALSYQNLVSNHIFRDCVNDFVNQKENLIGKSI